MPRPASEITSRTAKTTIAAISGVVLEHSQGPAVLSVRKSICFGCTDLCNYRIYLFTIDTVLQMLYNYTIHEIIICTTTPFNEKHLESA